MRDVRTWLFSLSPGNRERTLKDICDLYASTGEPKSLCHFLSNFDFIDIKIRELGIQKLISDYDFLEHPNITHHPDYQEDNITACQFIQKALQQAATILEEDNTQLPSQLLARLSSFTHPAIKKLLRGDRVIEGAKDCNLYPWLQALTVALGSVNQPFQKTIATNHDGKVDAIAISGDGKWALSARHNQVKLWNVSTGENQQTFQISEFYQTEDNSGLETRRKLDNTITALALSEDSHWAVIGFYFASKTLHSYIEVWDLEEEKQLIVFRVATGGTISSLAISRSGQQIIIGFGGDLFTVWALNDERTEATGTVTLNDALFHETGAANGTVALSPNGQWGVTTSEKFLLLWDFVKGRLVLSLLIDGKGAIKSLSLDCDGTITALFSNCTVNIWNIGLTDISDHVSIERGLIKLERRLRIQIGDSRDFREVFAALIQYLRQSPKILGLLSKLSHFRWGKWLASCFILQLQKPLLYIFYRLFYYQEKDFFAKNTIRTSDLKFLWSLIQLFSNKKPNKIAKLDLKGLNLPESITTNGNIGISKTETDELQLVDLKAARSGTINTIQDTIINEPWGRAIAISLDGRWVFSLGKGDALEMWDAFTREKCNILKKENLSSFWKRLISKKTYPLFTLNSIIKGEKIATFLYHLFNRDILLKDIDIVAKSLNGRWLFLISKNSFDVRDLGQKISDNSASRWYLRNVSPDGQWGLWQSSTRTLRVTNLKTGKLVGMLHDYYGNLADMDRWDSAFSKNDKKWKQANWKYHTRVNTITSISNNGGNVILYDTTSSDEWIWEPSQYLARWNVQVGNASKILNDYQGRKYELDSGAESAKQKWVLYTTAFVIFSKTRRAIFGLEQGTLKFCDLNTQKVILTFSGHRMKITDISLSSDEKWAVSCSLDQTVKIWSLPNCELIASFTTNSPLHTCRLAHTEARQLIIVTGDADKRTHILHLKLPENYELPPDEQIDDAPDASAEQQELYDNTEYRSATDYLRAGELIPDDSLVIDHAFPYRIGIPLPLHRLKTLPDELNSEVGISYIPLLELLKAGKWLDANEETKQLFCRVLGKKDTQDINGEELRQFPKNDLLSIDRLWLKYSEGRYGFSLQMRVWEKSQDSNDLDFLRTIGHEALDSCILLPCEPMHERQGFFPSLSFLNDNQSAKKFFIRLAECSGYPFITDDLSEAEINTSLYEGASSPEPSYSVEIADPALNQITLEDVRNFKSEEFYEYLNDLLKEKNWEEANIATKYRILKDDFDARQELKAIDALWMLHSNLRFGFSIQQGIWMLAQENHDEFSRRVEWIHEKENIVDKRIGTNFSLNAPVGHLPIFDFGKRGEVNDHSFYLLNNTLLDLAFSSPSLPTLLHPVILRGLPNSYAFIEFLGEHDGIINLDFKLNNKPYDQQQFIYQRSTNGNTSFVSIRLPSDIWDDSLIGIFAFKEKPEDIIPCAFFSIQIICPVNNNNYDDYLKIIKINNDKTKLYQLLEFKKSILGAEHQDVLFTMMDLIEQCNKIESYSEAELLIQQTEMIQQRKVKREIGFQNKGIVLFLSLEEWKQTHNIGIS